MADEDRSGVRGHSTVRPTAGEPSPLVQFLRATALAAVAGCLLYRMVS